LVALHGALVVTFARAPIRHVPSLRTMPRGRASIAAGASSTEPTTASRKRPASAAQGEEPGSGKKGKAPAEEDAPASKVAGAALVTDDKKGGRAVQLASREVVPRAPTPRAPAPPSPEDALTLTSWNVGGLRSWLASDERRAELTVTVLASPAPDVLFLLETKLQAGKIEDEAKAALAQCLPGYEAYFTSSSAKKGYSGVCALVRTAATLGGIEPIYGIGECDDEGRALTLPIRRPGCAPLDVVCCYVPNSGEGLKRLAYRLDTWDPALRSYLRARAAAPGRPQVCLLGDLNVAHLDSDIWNWGPSASKNKALEKNAGLTPGERASFTQMLAECELTDAFRALHPEAQGCFSYWSVRASGRSVNRGLRLDYALVSAAIASASGSALGWALHDAFTLDETNTRGDHAPVGVTLVPKK